jgi:hypothetical protein
MPRPGTLGRKTSDVQKTEVKVAPALGEYAGTYVEQPKFWRTAQNDRDFSLWRCLVRRSTEGAGAAQRAIGNNFTGIQGGIDFIQTGPAAPDLFVKHVSGNYRFARKK